MGSYVISVSAGTGCYRHIQISKSATLYKLHKAIISAFDFDDDHAHAFFMDNHYWSGYAAFFSMKMRGDERLTKSYKLEKLKLSKGDQFKYVFDFGDEWRFQCKVLRELDEQLDIPRVIRSVGESPEQHPDWDEEEWEYDDEDEYRPMSQEEIDELYALVPLSKEQVDLIHTYMDAAARLYGLVSLAKLYEIYNEQNAPVDTVAFIRAASLIGRMDNDYEVLERRDMPTNTDKEILEAGEVIADYLFVDDPESDIYDLRRQQKGKEYKVLPKAEFLKYADPDYYPVTPARTAMLKYLQRRAAKLTLPVEDFCTAIQEIIVIDAPMQEVVNIVEAEGLTFNKHWDIGEFAALYKDLNNTTHKHANCGRTPNEMFAMSDKGKKLAERIAPVGQMSLFDGPEEKPKLTLVGGPSRNAPCPCGSGRKYKNCCGK
ncbi:MAG: hypothetical protein E7438_00335 [Ruminococcaceae bacterium]|nr:hypothetical protein [Oscillospiraceae bacterium]